MSTILKALRRLEHDKQPESDRPLREDVVELRPGEPQPGRPPRTLWWAAGGGVVLVSVLVSVGLWLRSGPPVSVAPARESTVSVAPAQRSPRAARPEAPIAEVAKTPPPPIREIPDAIPQPARIPEAAAPTRPEPVKAARVPTPPEPAAERPYRLPDPEPMHAFESQAAPKPTPAPARSPAEPRVAVVERAPSPAPARAAPTPPAPEARVQSTTWHPQADRRLAVVIAPGRGPVSLREGDAMGELVIQRIEPAGVVFLYRGQEVRRRVGD